MAILSFAGNQIGAQFSVNEDQGDFVKWDIGQTPFLATDIVRIEIDDADIGPDGEFDPTKVNFLSFTVERDGVVHEFGIVVDAKIKESGGGSNIEQGESYFVTNDQVAPPSSGPFAGLNTQPYLFSTETAFTGGPDDYALRRFGEADLNNDGDFDDRGETGDGNFNAQPVCFAAGTLIATPKGERPVEDLWVGDLVETVGAGPQVIRWIGRTTHHLIDGDKNTRPIQIKAGALGRGAPRRDLVVSPQHRMLLSGPAVERLFGASEVLALAKGLTGLPGVRVMKGKRQVTYLSILLESHQILIANGARAESFYPGPTALQMVSGRHKAEIRAALSRLILDPGAGFGPTARPVLTRKEAERLASVLRRAATTAEVGQNDVAPPVVQCTQAAQRLQTATPHAVRPVDQKLRSMMAPRDCRAAFPRTRSGGSLSRASQSSPDRRATQSLRPRPA